MAIQIPVEVKKVCCQMKAEGRSNKEIYETYFLPETNSPASENSFRSMLNRWQHKQWADDTTLKCGTYEGFIAHDATVQVTKDGEIILTSVKPFGKKRMDAYSYVNGVGKDNLIGKVFK